MCTLALLLRPGLLAVSGNRNERLARPASPPAVDLQQGVLAPRDESAHGTWLGLNRHGLFVCITNRRLAAPAEGGLATPNQGQPPGAADERRRSRGLLVRDSLQARSALELHAQLAALDPLLYNGFHLVYADLRAAFVTAGTGAALEQRTLAQGEVHVITERSFGAGEGERETAALADCALAFRSEDLRAWREPMRRHAREPLESACVHAESFGYGTRSSLQLRLGKSGASALWTEGHPCVNEPRDLAPLLAQL